MWVSWPFPLFSQCYSHMVLCQVHLSRDGIRDTLHDCTHTPFGWTCCDCGHVSQVVVTQSDRWNQALGFLRKSFYFSLSHKSESNNTQYSNEILAKSFAPRQGERYSENGSKIEESKLPNQILPNVQRASCSLQLTGQIAEMHTGDLRRRLGGGNLPVCGIRVQPLVQTHECSGFQATATPQPNVWEGRVTKHSF